MTIPDDALAALAEVVGSGGLRSGEAIPARNRKDASKTEEGLPALLVMPRTTEEVAAVLAICSRFSLPVVVQGGMTGLAGGAAPQAGEVALSLEKMTGVEEIDPVTRTMTVLAGTPLAVVQEKAATAGFLYGVDLGARLDRLFPPHDFMQKLIGIGRVDFETAYRQWNMGNAMLLVVPPAAADQTLSVLAARKVPAKLAGEIVPGPIVIQGVPFNP